LANARQKCLACLIRSQPEANLYLMFNADTEGMAFVLPSAGEGRWQLAVDTAQALPRDFYVPGKEALIANPQSYTLESRSSAVLVAR